MFQYKVLKFNSSEDPKPSALFLIQFPFIQSQGQRMTVGDDFELPSLQIYMKAPQSINYVQRLQFKAMVSRLGIGCPLGKIKIG